jgi:hypothetical protein
LQLPYVGEGFAEEIITEVGHQVTNPDGIDFDAIMNLPSMFILEKVEEKVNILSIIGQGIQ